MSKTVHWAVGGRHGAVRLQRRRLDVPGGRHGAVLLRRRVVLRTLVTCYMYECPSDHYQQSASAGGLLHVELPGMSTKLSNGFAGQSVNFLQHEDIGLRKNLLEELDLGLPQGHVSAHEASGIPGDKPEIPAAGTSEGAKGPT